MRLVFNEEDIYLHTETDAFLQPQILNSIIFKLILHSQRAKAALLPQQNSFCGLLFCYHQRLQVVFGAGAAGCPTFNAPLLQQRPAELNIAALANERRRGGAWMMMLGYGCVGHDVERKEE